MKNFLIRLDIRLIGIGHKLKKLKEFWKLYIKSCANIDKEIEKILEEAKWFN